MTDRTILRVSGADRFEFLQGLITNDINGLKDGLVYAALLTPQGKYIADFFLQAAEEAILLDVATPVAAPLFQRLSMYRLRSDVAIEETSLSLSRGLTNAPPDAFPDPRHPDMGWRLISDTPGPQDQTDWNAMRVLHSIPESGVELTSDSYILEMGFERLSGVDFKKGCYVGQEVTARMKHKTALRKGLAQVDISGSAEPGTAITIEGKPVGTLHTVSGSKALAYLRFDRATTGMRAGDAEINWAG